MNKYIKTLVLTLPLIVAATACSDDEEILTPTTGVVDNKFAVPDDATGPEADLRREFFDQTGIYLMFNDLLSSEVIGQDVHGNDIYKNEYIDFNYGLTSMNDAELVIDFLETQAEKEKAAGLFKRYIYPHIEGGKLSPFSILPAKSLMKPKYETYGTLVKANTISCWRCLAISVGDWIEMDDAEAADYAATILKDLVGSKFKYSSDEAREFMDISYVYAYEYISDYEPDWDRTDSDIPYSYGFLSYVQGWRSPAGDYFPSASNDFADFFNAVMTRSEEDFMAEYGQYPEVVNKYRIMRDCIAALGYKF